MSGKGGGGESIHICTGPKAQAKKRGKKHTDAPAEQSDESGEN